MTFEDFERIITNDVKADKQELYVFLTEWLKRLPIPNVLINPNTFIERAVLIAKDKEPFDIQRLSYIPSKLSHLAKEGRFNNAGEPTFYAAFTDLDQPETTRYFLATELDHSLKNHQFKSFPITLTKWLSTHSFPALFLLFKEAYCTNKLMSNAFEKIIASEEFLKLKKEEIRFFELITEEIAKPESANNYTITNIVFDFYKEKGYKAIVYPGVRSKYRGTNIAMLPEITDNNWDFCFGAEFYLKQTGDDISIEPVYKINHKNGKLIYSRFGTSEVGEETSIDK